MKYGFYYNESKKCTHRYQDEDRSNLCLLWCNLEFLVDESDSLLKEISVKQIEAGVSVLVPEAFDYYNREGTRVTQ